MYVNNGVNYLLYQNLKKRLKQLASSLPAFGLNISNLKNERGKNEYSLHKMHTETLAENYVSFNPYKNKK